MDLEYLGELFGLQGKVAVVTGGSRGIGQTVSIALAKAGATVAILCRGGAEDTLATIAAQGGTAYALPTDVAREDSIDAALCEVLRRSERLDIVFNNAGICLHKSTMEATVDEWQRVLDVNLTGVYMVARAAGKIMVERGIHGCIINNASMSGTVVNVPQWQCSYNASKAGVIHLTKSLAVEWAPYGIRVNSLSPGYIGTKMSADTPQALQDEWRALTPQARMGAPEELVPAVLYLASAAAGYTTGSDVIVDGGYTCR